MRSPAPSPRTRTESAIDALLPGLRHVAWTSRTQARARFKALCLDEMESLLPESGLMLDLGCGQGIASHWLARRRPRARVVAVDFDRRKIDDARRFAPVPENLEFVEGDAIGAARGLRGSSVRVALLADFLSSLALDRQRELLGVLADRLEPGGLLVVLFVDTEPRWRFELNRARSTILCKVLRLSRIDGSSFGYVGLATYREWIERDGLSVTAASPLPGLAPRRRLVAKRVAT